MAKYRDFDDDYEYDGDYEYDLKPERGDNYTATKKRTDETGVRTDKKTKKPMKRWVKILICVVEVVVLVGLLGMVYLIDKLDNVQYAPLDPEFIMDNQEQMDEETQQVLKGYTNILLVGSDARDNSVEALDKTLVNHSDTLIICSINNDTKEIKLVSVYRDTILKMSKPEDPTDYKYRKATEAMFYYGPQSTLNMINVNMDLNITDYVMVNWSALIDIIDAVGGVDIEITEEERDWLNKYLVDTSVNTGKKYTEVKNSGYVHLDGIQATAYCRVRFTAGSDYRRTERQRTVLTEVFKKAKSMNLAQLNAAINAVVGNVATSFSPDELIDMAADITKYNLTETSGFPFKLDDTGYIFLNDKPHYVVTPMDLQGNVTELHKFLFGTEDYTPTATVQDISKNISSLVSFEQYVEPTEPATEAKTEAQTEAKKAE